jgi:hypothetical protein
LFTGIVHKESVNNARSIGKTSAMSFTADFDIASFGLGFAVAPVAYFVFGAAIYGVFCTGRWLTVPFRRRWKPI